MSDTHKSELHLDVAGIDHTIKDRQTVHSDGTPVMSLIDGVRQRPLVTHADERGTLCEVMSTSWGFDDQPIVYMYQASLLPGYVKGWIVHAHQDDRLFLATGRMRVILYDGRTQSGTFGYVNRFEAGELNRCLLRIPAGVYHAVQNIGTTEAFYYNLPTKPYCHENPDKFRLPLDNDIIPYRFHDAKGW